MNKLFTPETLGNLELKNRIVMAPLTRCRAGEDRMPNDLMVEYYSDRASSGVIISEATVISESAVGYLGTPGIYSPEQVREWKKVTKAVHDKGGKIFLQLWHCGRVSHSSLLPQNQLPVSSSMKKITGKVYTPSGMQDYEMPRELTRTEIKSVINALEAGFDGVEIHAANGYLIDQFLRNGVNQRNDDYGGTPENRTRFLFEVIEAVLKVWPSYKVGVRLSPSGTFNEMSDSNPEILYTYLAKEINKYNLSYLHIVEMLEGDKKYGGKEVNTAIFRELFKGSIIVCGNYTKEKAEKVLENNLADFVAFGTLYIANPDLVLRLEKDIELNKPDFKTFYSPGIKGYNDYPKIQN